MESGGETSDRENRFGLQTDFKIGGAPSDQLQIYYTNKVSWYKEDELFPDKDKRKHYHKIKELHDKISSKH